MTKKIRRVQAPQTKATRMVIEHELDELTKWSKINLGMHLSRRNGRRNLGVGRNRDLATGSGQANERPKYTSVGSKSIQEITNVEGNLATVEVKHGDVKMDTVHKLAEDERKIRRMKNKQRRLGRLRRNKKSHGRSVRVAN